MRRSISFSVVLEARSVVRDLDPMNDLTFLRIRSKKHEPWQRERNNIRLKMIQHSHWEFQKKPFGSVVLVFIATTLLIQAAAVPFA